jgi:hypothetical protein
MDMTRRELINVSRRFSTASYRRAERALPIFEVDKWARSRFCGTGCGVGVKNGKVVGIRIPKRTNYGSCAERVRV